VHQGLRLNDPDFGQIDFYEITSWFDDESLDGPTSLQTLCSNIDVEASWVRRKIGEWRKGRLAGGVDRLVPPQHYRGEADAA
jgi:hypothetical protein